MIAFDNVGTIGNKNEYSIKQVHTVSFQPNYVSTLPGKTKNSIKTAKFLLQCILFNRIVPNFCRKSFDVCVFSLFAIKFF